MAFTKRSVVLVALSSAIAVVLVAGSVWAISSYRDSQLDQEARDHVAAVLEARASFDRAVGEHSSSLTSAKEHQEKLAELTEQLMAARSEYFDEKALGAYGKAVDRLNELVAADAETSVALEPPFDADDPEQAFVDAYRDADSAGRDALATAGTETAQRLEQQVTEITTAGNELSEAVTTAQRNAVAIAVKLPDTAERIAKKYDESAKRPVKELREAAKAEGFEQASDDGMADRFGELSTLFEKYVTAADKARKSHNDAVAEREAASSRGGSGGGGRDYPRLCNRFMPDLSGQSGGYLALVPC